MIYLSLFIVVGALIFLPWKTISTMLKIFFIPTTYVLMMLAGDELFSTFVYSGWHHDYIGTTFTIALPFILIYLIRRTYIYMRDATIYNDIKW